METFVQALVHALLQTAFLMAHGERLVGWGKILYVRMEFRSHSGASKKGLIVACTKWRRKWKKKQGKGYFQRKKNGQNRMKMLTDWKTKDSLFRCAPTVVLEARELELFQAFLTTGTSQFCHWIDCKTITGKTEQNDASRRPQCIFVVDPIIFTRNHSKYPGQ